MTDLATALPLLSVITGGVLLIATFARDPKADERDVHDVSDYVPTLAPERRNWPLADQKRTDYTWGRADYTWGYADDDLPPAPEGMNAGSPLYAAMLFDTWFPETAEDRAARYLREIRDEALAGAR